MTEEIDDTDDTKTIESSGSGSSRSEAGGSEPSASTRGSAASADAVATPASDRRAGDASVGDAEGGRSRDMVRYVNYLVLVALVVLALVAGIQFYGAVSRTINQWVTAEYRSLFHGAFNLAVLLIAAAGVSLQVRRVTS